MGILNVFIVYHVPDNWQYWNIIYCIHIIDGIYHNTVKDALLIRAVKET